ncbi:hypothetical protein [Leptolyngbya sp. CCNP1308]|nr:hypothetical protein [Leptolyngbya sp. CCNP1308]
MIDHSFPWGEGRRNAFLDGVWGQRNGPGGRSGFEPNCAPLLLRDRPS